MISQELLDLKKRQDELYEISGKVRLEKFQLDSIKKQLESEKGIFYDERYGLYQQLQESNRIYNSSCNFFGYT